MKTPELRRALSAWPILALALIGIIVSLQAGCSDDCRRTTRSGQCIEED